MARLQTIPTDPPSGYQLDALLGAGGMGAVYRARQLSAGGRLVALKRIAVPGDAELLARIRREAGVLAGLDHPHIVRCYEFVPDGEGIAIAMQYAAGGSLAERLDLEGRLDAAAVVAIAEPIARALGSAHTRGVVHGDVKPANILFTADGEPLLSDFGIAGHCHADQDESAATANRRGHRDGSQLGTPEYLDPEVAGGRPPDARSDVYSLGVVCYEALTGRLPAADARAAPAGMACASGWVPLAQAAPDCPAWMATVVERALSRFREARFADAAEFAAALRSGGLRPSPATRPFGPRPPAPGPSEAPAPIAVPKAAVWGAAVALLLLPLLAVLLSSAR